jgi:hypothetical protein
LKFTMNVRGVISLLSGGSAHRGYKSSPPALYATGGLGVVFGLFFPSVVVQVPVQLLNLSVL